MSKRIEKLTSFIGSTTDEKIKAAGQKKLVELTNIEKLLSDLNANSESYKEWSEKADHLSNWTGKKIGGGKETDPAENIEKFFNLGGKFDTPKTVYARTILIVADDKDKITALDDLLKDYRLFSKDFDKTGINYRYENQPEITTRDGDKITFNPAILKSAIKKAGKSEKPNN